MSSRHALLLCGFVAAIFALGAHSGSLPDTDNETDVAVTRKGYTVGEQLRSHTRVELQLSATVSLGFVTQPVSYSLTENETYTVVFSSEDDSAELSRQLTYPQAQRITVAPLVGKRVKDRRVSGKSYRVRRSDDGLSVANPDGSETREKEAREVRRSCRIVGNKPALFALLPQGELKPGATFDAEGEPAKRLLGLSLDELTADTLQLTYKGPGEGNQLLFDAGASLSGSAELAGRTLNLNAELTGQLVADRRTGRMVRLELSGALDVGSSGASSADNAAGSGTLSIHRTMSRDV
ncbi:MAG: hypothetical protein ACI9EF_002547 [Pseudohongiellaceae bacterium]|jgi:hypothetical protein